MQRVNNLLPQIEDMDNLRLAFWKASKGKRYSKAVLSYQNNLETNLKSLQWEIQKGNVSVGDYSYFTIYEPKEREICASSFSEQVLHHALMNICHDYFDRSLIHATYASRKGKGTYAALEKAKILTKKNSWYLKLDVKKFFGSIHHDVLKSQLARRFKEKLLLQIFYKIIDSYEASPARGLPIGNLTSQYFANHYLASLDSFIKQILHAKAYVRYMDDMIVWHNDKKVLQAYLLEIESYVHTHLKVELKPIQLNRTQNGVPFLGYRIFSYHVRLLQKSKQRYIRKVNQALIDWHRLNSDDNASAAKVLPLLAFTRHADSVGLRKKILFHAKGQIP
jgi:RNA-directed DNA polymerase